MSEDRLLAVADELYALPPGDFTAARDARVRELRGDKALAARVKALRKPSVGAWAVNLLVRREGDRISELLAVGTALREAQAGLDAGRLRELTRQRRALTAAVAGLARGLAAQEGQRLSTAALAQVEDSLTAAMLDEGAATALRSGLLIAPLTATGVEAADVAPALAVPEALGFAAPARSAPPAPGLRVVPDPDAEEKARAAADRELARAETELEQANDALARIESELSDLTARELQVHGELEELRRRLADLEGEAEQVEEELVECEEARDEAQASVAEATRLRDDARERRDALG